MLDSLTVPNFGQDTICPKILITSIKFIDHCWDRTSCSAGLVTGKSISTQMDIVTHGHKQQLSSYSIRRAAAFSEVFTQCETIMATLSSIKPSRQSVKVLINDTST
jgi:hypothetical protein